MTSNLIGKNSKRFLSVISVLALSLVLSGCQTVSQWTANKTPESKPNILWITIEDTSPHFIGAYGNKDARTPTIDQLAKEGVQFSNAFATGTVCSASRAAIITGVKTYKTGMGNHRRGVSVPDYMKGFPYYLKQQGYYTSNNKKTDYNVSGSKAYTEEAWHESSVNAGWWNRSEAQPFFSVFNYNESHQSRTMTFSYEKYQNMVLDQLDEAERITPKEFQMPPFYNDTPQMRKQFARVYNSLKLTDNKVAELLQHLENDGLKDDTIIFFYGDHGEGIPRGKTNGINLGYRVPFIVWFPEKYKHLSPWGTGVVTDELVSFEDLAPTMIALAQGQVPEHMTGRVLMGDKRSEQTEHLVLSSDRADNGIEMSRTVTDGEYVYSRNFMPYLPQMRYIRYFEISEIQQLMRKDHAEGKLNTLQQSLFQQRPVETLYHVTSDPWELQDLAKDQKHSKVLDKMRAQLKREMIAAKDVLMIPEYEIGLIEQSSTPYEFRLTDSYAAEQIVDAAMLSGLTNRAALKQQLALLKSDDKFVRYWAVTGLRSHNKEALTPFLAELKHAMKDEYPPVAITLAATLFELFEDKQAQALLNQYCLNENNDLALLTLHHLMYVQNKAPFIDSVQASRKLAVRNYAANAAAADLLAREGLIPNTPEFKQ